MILGETNLWVYSVEKKSMATMFGGCVMVQKVLKWVINTQMNIYIIDF